MWSFDQHAHRRPISGLRPPSRGNCFFATSLPTPRNQSGCADRWPHLIPQSSQVFDVFLANSGVELPTANGLRGQSSLAVAYSPISTRPPDRKSYFPVTATLIFWVSQPNISPFFGAQFTTY